MFSIIGRIGAGDNDIGFSDRCEIAVNAQNSAAIQTYIPRDRGLCGGFRSGVSSGAERPGWVRDRAVVEGADDRRRPIRIPPSPHGGGAGAHRGAIGRRSFRCRPIPGPIGDGRGSGQMSVWMPERRSGDWVPSAERYADTPRARRRRVARRNFGGRDFVGFRRLVERPRGASVGWRERGAASPSGDPDQPENWSGVGGLSLPLVVLLENTLLMIPGEVPPQAAEDSLECVADHAMKWGG